MTTKPIHQRGQAEDADGQVVKSVTSDDRLRPGDDLMNGRCRERASEAMTAKEVCDYLGIGINQLYAAAANKELPARRVGRRWLFSRSQIVRWFQGNEYGMPESK